MLFEPLSAPKETAATISTHVSTGDPQENRFETSLYQHSRHSIRKEADHDHEVDRLPLRLSQQIYVAREHEDAQRLKIKATGGLTNGQQMQFVSSFMVVSVEMP
jgi:hypothetical protein